MSRSARQLAGAPARAIRDCCLAACLATGTLAGQEATLVATVFDERTGETVTGLGPERFSIKDGDVRLRVLAATEARAPLDVLLLVDASMVGETVRPIAVALIDELDGSEQMALVGFDHDAVLLQDFTSEKRFLHEALDRTEYANVPRVHDALFASIDGGFDFSAHRRAVVLLSSGMTARGGVSEADVVETARARRASIFSVFVRTDARGLLRRLAFRTGGAAFAARRLKLEPRALAQRIFAAMRSPYELAVTGVFALGERIQASITGADKTAARLSVSVLPVD